MLGFFPIIQQFRLVKQAPVFHNAGDFSWKLALRDQTGFNRDQSFKPLLLHMDMRWRVIVVPHAYDDPEEDGNRWHGSHS